jgi:dTDP-glucose 4,6-dehydratase
MATAGAGFIGTVVVCQFIAKTGAIVINIDKLTCAGNLDSLPGLMGHTRRTFEAEIFA